ncbi:MAG: cysteine dioxygenase [Proteobacteria bacterium]|nr:cysteine dioxygenase [Pseudomonadota bacterium]
MNPLQDVIHRLDEAVGDCADIPCAVAAVKATLVDCLGANTWLPACAKEQDVGYARHLLYRCPQGRFSIVAMVWGVGQATPIHDHDGIWCVEGVYHGEIKVTSYDLVGQLADTCRFEPHREIQQGVGAAGSLIPPVEHHVIQNAGATPAVTVHVYGGELESCAVFLPVGGDRYERVVKPLSYTSIVDVAA